MAYGATPDFIQVGNEVNNGMLWNSTSSDKCYANSTGDVMTHFISYIKNGCTACREVCPSAKIIFHVAMEYNATLDWANWAPKTWPATLATNSVDYDIIGLSYYPYYHGPLNYLTTLLTYLKTNFPTKEVQLVEVGYPHAYYPTSNSYDYTGTYNATDAGQLAFTTALITALADYPQVTGLYWWFPEANEYGNSGSKVTTNWYNYGLWDNSTGKAMQSVAKLQDFTTSIGDYVGAIDNSTGWWSAFSDYYTIAQNQVLTLTFTNYTNQAETWNNWMVAITTDADRGASSYAEYLLLRADNYGWGNSYATGALTNNFNWDTFKSDMDGAAVTLTITRSGPKVTIRADITPAAGGSYYEELVAVCSSGSQNIRAFLTTQAGHLTNLRASTTTNASATTISDYIIEKKGDITALINGTFDSNADGWSGYTSWWANLDWTNRSWRGTSVNGGWIERNSDGTMTCTVSNMPAGTYKVVAAARTYAGGKLKAQVAGGAYGTEITGTGDGTPADGTMEINTNGVEMPYSSLGGFTTEPLGHNWHWISATGTLASAGELVINFTATGTSWMAIDDVHLYCTSLDGTSYTTTLNNITANRTVVNTGNNSVVTADIVTSNPNVILRSAGGGNITTAAGASMNNLMYKSGGYCYIDKMVLYDGNAFTDYVENDGYFCYDATLYRSIPADTWCSLVIPFWPTTTLTMKYPSAFDAGTGELTFADVTNSTCWNDEPMLIKSSSSLTAITGKRAGTGAGASGITYGDMTSGAGVPMTGVYTANQTVPTSTASTYYYALGTDNNLHKVTGGTVNIAPFRAYFTLDNSAGGEAPARISLNFDDEPAGINVVNGSGAKVNGYYNLSGQRIDGSRFTVNGSSTSEAAKPSAGLKPGLYIVRSAEGRLQGKNGKKVIIK